jgi:molybdopterin synthase catalytic subunit
MKINSTPKEMKSGIYEKGAFTFEDVYNSIKAHPLIKKSGSILTFTGIVRETSKTGKFIKDLEIEAYEELGNQIICEICKSIKEKYDLIDIKIVHLKGRFDISEDLVYVLVASAHRPEGFNALMEAVERYKSELTVWMKEELLDGTSQRG